jgi:hypothetical protein
MTDFVADISSIIPRMIFGIVLIIAWAPVILFSELNNKGNQDEYKFLLDKLANNTIFTDMTSQISYPSLIINNAYVNYYEIKADDTTNGNIYISTIKITKTKDANGKNTITKEFSNEFLSPIKVNNTEMDNENYKYLAMQNKIISTTVEHPTDSNISYEINGYAIPRNKQIMKVEGLQEFQTELDMTIYDYEFGPKSKAIEAIKNRKTASNTFQIWLGRIGTFFMLFGGLMLLVAPLQTIINMGESLPGPLKILALPGKILMNIYSSLSFFGAFILTLLMTLFIWSLVNYPLVSVLIGGLIIGLMMYFGKK